MTEEEIIQIIARAQVGTMVLIFIGIITFLFLLWSNTTLSYELKLSMTNSLFLALLAVSTFASAYFKRKNTKEPKNNP